jgi:cobalamin biosynthesis Mg chelatase CobN
LSANAKEKGKKESLERLMNQYEQAKTNGDSALAKKIKAIIERVKGK